MKKFVVAGTAAFAIAATLYFIFGRTKKSEVQYTEVQVQRADLRLTVTSTGTVTPEGRIEMKPPVPGRIDSVGVREGQKVRRGQIIAWMSSTERAALLDSARAVSNEEYKRFQEYYKATPIVAPVSGTIILRSVEPGQTVASADVLLVISDRLQVVAKVDETDIARVKPGIAVEVVLDAYPQETIAAKVSNIAFEAKTVNNVTAYDVEILPTKQPDYMRSGMTANVTFVLKQREDVLTVPVAAIQFKKESPFVLVRDKQGKAAETAVEIGESDGSNTEIISGLDEQSKVLIAKIQMPGAGKGSNPFMPARGGRATGSRMQAAPTDGPGGGRSGGGGSGKSRAH